MDFREMLQDLVNQDDETKINIAAKCYAELLPTFKKLDPDSDGMMITYALLSTTAAADGELTAAEFRFIDALLEARGVSLSQEQIVQLVGKAAGNRTAYSLVREIRDQLNDDGMVILINFLAALCSIDDRISKEEIAFLEDMI
ncbi:MAG: helix-turn-helix domain-containing protein [Lachnospiraceae bacterium]|nr:helix-turn-helix domain-containing protein [Lachnospiraceae bacterium]